MADVAVVLGAGVVVAPNEGKVDVAVLVVPNDRDVPVCWPSVGNVELEAEPNENPVEAAGVVVEVAG